MNHFDVMKAYSNSCQNAEEFEKAKLRKDTAPEPDHISEGSTSPKPASARTRYGHQRTLELDKAERDVRVHNIISAPYKICEKQCRDLQRECEARGECCFNPETDFEKFGVLPEFQSAGWVETWHRVLKICILKGGKAYIMRSTSPKRHGLIGGQQGGELSLCLGLENEPLLEIVFVDYEPTEEQLISMDEEEKSRAHALKFGENWVFKNQDVTIHKQLGHGGSAVFSATLKVGGGRFFETVAAKSLVVPQADREEVEKKLKREFDALQVLKDCENIVKLIGVVLDSRDSIYLLMEYSSRGSLRRVLEVDSGEILQSKRVQLQVATHVARGMQFMHSKNIIHRDVKSDNILIFKQIDHLDTNVTRTVAKVTDFGLAVGVNPTRQTTHVSPGGAGTCAYKAPELFDDHLPTDTEQLKPIDVYAFGMIVYELLTAKLPWDGFTELQIMRKVGLEKTHPDLDAELASSNLGKICKECWAHSPSERPTFAEVSTRLEAESPPTASSASTTSLVPEPIRTTSVSHSPLPILPEQARPPGQLRPEQFHVGKGDAYEEALEDPSPIVQVDWYTYQPSDDISHSLLAVHVFRGDLSDPNPDKVHKYVIEKAMLSDNEADQGPFRHGIRVSFWKDVYPLLADSNPIHVLQYRDIKDGLRLPNVRRIALDQGPYNINDCNSHHMARAAFNSCAVSERFHIQELPNDGFVCVSQRLECSRSVRSEEKPDIDERAPSNSSGGPKFKDILSHTHVATESDGDIQVAAKRIADTIRSSVRLHLQGIADLRSILADVHSLVLGLSWGNPDREEEQFRVQLSMNILVMLRLKKTERTETVGLAFFGNKKHHLQVEYELHRMRAANEVARRECEPRPGEDDSARMDRLKCIGILKLDLPQETSI